MTARGRAAARTIGRSTGRGFLMARTWGVPGEEGIARPGRPAACDHRDMEILLYALGAAALLAGMAGVVLPALPGAPLLVAGALLVGWADGFTRVSGWTVAACALLGAAIWAVDLAAGVLGARAFGASRWSVVGSGVGLVAGLFLGLPGIVLGPAVGALVFEYARNPDFARAAKAGVGAFVGFVLGSVAKVALSFVLVGVLVVALVF
jgi:uncharacterized protein YqgC (DUF456 family)